MSGWRKLLLWFNRSRSKTNPVKGLEPVLRTEVHGFQLKKPTVLNRQCLANRESCESCDLLIGTYPDGNYWRREITEQNLAIASLLPDGLVWDIARIGL
jgi:hypothetical protein